MTNKMKIVLSLCVTVAALGVAGGVAGAAWIFKDGKPPAATGGKQFNGVAIDGMLDPTPSADPQTASDVEGSKLEGTSPASFLKPGAKLTVGQSLTSPNGKFVLTQQTDGNLVLVDAAKKAQWSSQTYRNAGAYTKFGNDGNLVVYATDDRPLWHTATTGSGATFAVQDDGIAVVYSAAKKGLWASKAEVYKLYPNQGLTAGQSRKSIDGRHTLVQYADGNLVVVDANKKAIWSSQTHGNPGATTHMGGDGNLVVYSASKKPLWYSATAGNPNAAFFVQNDGNAVVRTSDGKALWGTASHGVSMLTMGQRLAVGQFRKSPNGSYMLFQQEDGNLVLRDAAGNAIWSNSVGGKGVATHMQADGNVVSRSASGDPLWHTQTNPGRGCFLLVQNDGNLVLYNADLKVIWTR